MFESDSFFLLLDGLSFTLGQLSEGRTLLVVFDDVIIEDVAVVASHLQRGMSHDLLKGERIAAAIYQILSSKSVSERMDRSPFHASIGVVLHDSKPQSVLSQETAELITEQVIRRFTLPNCHIIPQNGHHRSAERDDLNLAILCVSENNLLSTQVYILILNVANSSSPTTTVEQKIDDDPVAILAEIAVRFRLPQERHEFIVCVSFLHSFRSLVDFEIGFCVALFVTPREENLQSPSVTVDRTVRQTIFTHLQDHLIKVFGSD